MSVYKIKILEISLYFQEHRSELQKNLKMLCAMLCDGVYVYNIIPPLYKMELYDKHLCTCNSI